MKKRCVFFPPTGLDYWVVEVFFLNRNNLRNAPKVVFQAELEKLERELKKLNGQSAATSDKEEKSKLIERLSKVEK